MINRELKETDRFYNNKKEKFFHLSFMYVKSTENLKHKYDKKRTAEFT